MDSLSFYVGVIGNIISVLLFLSPSWTFWQIVKHGSTEEFESFPYVCALLGSSLWTYYGITKPGSYLVATVNGFGVVAEIIYVSLFLIFAPPRIRARTAVLAGILDVGFLAAAILVTHYAMHGDLRIDVIGFMCSGLNIVMYGSPLAAMVPNGTGFVLGTVQLVLYAIYRKSKPAKSTISDDLEDGWQQEHLLPPSSSGPSHNKSQE
ncbi:hypothetical protein F0562_029293 [Nyssa sinensis]|uniref:Bidirectional sugar transporter SWEET n=1 Tax=Nyssa sinensis TaxID=561372 RepID=A0A5J5B0M5_9ASTE|nr:hypothetical protein F0562_029293 [Nyssa sinensis]